jgi:hypothetical protein
MTHTPTYCIEVHGIGWIVQDTQGNHLSDEEITRRMASAAYDTLKKCRPNLLETIDALVRSGQTPKQIADEVEKQDIILASLAAMAAAHIQEQTK